MPREAFFIIDAHLLLMRDEMLWREVETVIEEELVNAEWALRKVINRWVKVFDELTDEYLRERGHDVDIVGERVLAKLTGHKDRDLGKIQEPVIVVAPDLRPDQTAPCFFPRCSGSQPISGPGPAIPRLWPAPWKSPRWWDSSASPSRWKTATSSSWTGLKARSWSTPTRPCAKFISIKRASLMRSTG